MIINGLSAIVTGGVLGLGAATARLLASKGAMATLFGLNAEMGEPLARENGGLSRSVNVTDEDSVAAGLDTAETDDGVARILINRARVAPAIKAVGREFKPHSIDSLRKAVEINLVGTFVASHLLRACNR